MDHSFRVLKLFLVFWYFLSESMVFGVVYAWLYKKNPGHFVFNADITKRQKEASRAEWDQELSQHRRIQSLIQDLHAALARGDATILPESAPGDVVLKSGYRYSFTISGGEFNPLMTVLEIFDENDKRLQTYFHPSIKGMPENAADSKGFREFSNSFLEKLEDRCKALEKLLASISTEAPAIWGFWDFLYFSVVIQTTIGLGDILPNSTLVRKLVILQTILGYAILFLFLNLVLGG